MPYVPMDPDVITDILKEYTDILTPEQEKLDSFYRQFVCPSCRSTNMVKHFTAAHAFADSTWKVPRATLICADCSCHMDPHSGLLLARGNTNKIIPVSYDL
jgi:hypothetical protein